MDRPTDTPGTPIDSPDRVITQQGGGLACLQCQAPLRAPKFKTRPAKFCPGSACRSGWHLEQRRKLIAEIDERLNRIRAALAEVEALVGNLK